MAGPKQKAPMIQGHKDQKGKTGKKREREVDRKKERTVIQETVYWEYAYAFGLSIVTMAAILEDRSLTFKTSAPPPSPSPSPPSVLAIHNLDIYSTGALQTPYSLHPKSPTKRSSHSPMGICMYFRTTCSCIHHQDKLMDTRGKEAMGYWIERPVAAGSDRQEQARHKTNLSCAWSLHTAISRSERIPFTYKRA